jgi:hypothetical protein
LSNFRDIGGEGGIDLSLGSLSGLSSDGGLHVSGEEGVIDGRHVNASDRDIGGGGNNIFLVDSSEGDAVGGVGSCLMWKEIRKW